LLPSQMLEGIESAASSREYLLTLARLPDQRLTDAGSVPRILHQVLAEGLLILYNAHVPAGMVALIERHQVPAIWLNDRRDHDAVYPDDRGAGAAATRHLIELGHRRIAYVALSWARGQAPGHYSGAERLAGYRDAMRKEGLEPIEIFADRQGGLAAGERVPFLVQRLSGADRPTAVLGYNGEMGHAAMGAAIQLGLRLGRDLSVMAIEARQLSELGIEMAAAALPFRELGAVAVEMLLERIAAGHPLPARMLPVSVVAGQTAGPPPG
jgi:DNA-binding LacI/PurR family transcriptional regulator